MELVGLYTGLCVFGKEGRENAHMQIISMHQKIF